ncbi:LysM peptidoglycan-binding domain-containing protein [Lactiplantibacillus plantarum]|uniref:GH25 family lysozyme n=1 Tax=Lactiplantibacillus plantarum TaxID=1590 RepID=UPI001D08A491|nr:GH25 family lysozyme [Lactiplantibacillus plantarum]MCB7140038.1 LysM peptidoglycan-binding domain-containing protein [Lactiplantibacillus plantarum]MCB7156280.1 LysM peptidoglycan-binding domain-containing protein [Lactiplantibacillus plantarum]MCB7165889.1 LysM peptidoglycan-binding domain-containing protein [Lactiplantibacillus plantarum]MCB7166296.1 LysM peptidoglycan-binding domain-containing protein [Lactiplantibacillus plantarum]MCB7172641.1 LysM peptidoglycan-binding domain-containi
MIRLKLKSKLALTGAATMAALFLGLNANAARMDMVDVSNNNGYMSTAEYVSMRNEFGVKALTVKISEGTTFKDGYAASNIANGQAAGLYVNGYHFAHYKTKAQAIAEADFAGKTAKAAGLPVGAVLATDVESQEANNQSKATNDRNNAAFMKEIQKFGYRADIYTSGSWANSKMTIKGKTGWIAAYPYVVSGKNWYSTNHAWQWSSTAKFRISYGGFDVSQLNSNYYTAGQKSTVKPTNKGAVKANNQKANKNISKPSASAKWVKEAKTYTLKTAVKLRTGASTSSNVITILPAGTTVKTDHAIIQSGYRWVRQPRFNGYGYLATGPASNTLEYVKSGATHTYYTVKSGDSWWAIAQRNGLNMTTLASQNGKTIYTTIYPGQRLVVR